MRSTYEYSKNKTIRTGYNTKPVKNKAFLKTFFYLSHFRKTFQRVAKVCSKITELTANRMLLYALLEKEYKDVSLSNKFFRNIHSYINQDLLLTKYRTVSYKNSFFY